jgi:hypothetical protein
MLADLASRPKERATGYTGGLRRLDEALGDSAYAVVDELEAIARTHESTPARIAPHGGCEEFNANDAELWMDSYRDRAGVPR